MPAMRLTKQMVTDDDSPNRWQWYLETESDDERVDAALETVR